jgi:predicted dehydrogenase
MKKLRVGILGYGYWGPNLVRNLYKVSDCQVVAIADNDQRRLDAAVVAHPGLETSSDAQELLYRKDIDAIVVATPPSTHYLLASIALESGKHVLVEKPLSLNIDEAKSLIDMAKRHKLTLMVDHTFVYSGAVRMIRDIISSGELGDVWYVDAVRINLGLFQRDVNVIQDLGPHDFSILNYLIESDPKTVSAVGIAPVEYGSGTPISLAYLTVRLANGVLAQFHLSWLSPVKIRRMLIGGSQKTLVYDHLDPDHQIKIYDKGLETITEGDRRRLLTERRIGDMYAPKVDQTEPLEQMCQHFVECALSGKTPLSDGVDGLKVVRLIDATIQSLDQGGAVIAL